ncbi:MAG: glycosyltransferase family 9 protein [Chloroflexota bacterium]|nr:glycosyltransferase family 9 protein [Chloroflexota bacterium]
MQSGTLADIRRLAVLRANGLGDFLFCLPALEALRLAYPEAEIVLLASPWHEEFLAGRPGPVDRVVVVPPSQGVRVEPNTTPNAQELERFFAGMRAERFDLALQLHGGGRYSNPFVLELGARVTAGLRTADAAPLDLAVPYIYYQPEILRYLEVVSLVGARPSGLEPNVTLKEADVEEAQAVVPDDGRPLAVLHPGANDTRRQWPVEQFAAVGDALVDAGVRVLITGTEPERRLVEGVAHAMRRQAESLCGQLTIGGLAGLLSRCSVVVSNDSGPLHLAAAVGAPTVGIYWCGNLINAGPMTRSRHRPAVSWRLHCPVCGLDCTRDQCPHGASFVVEVAVDEVVSSALELLGR